MSRCCIDVNNTHKVTEARKKEVYISMSIQIALTHNQFLIFYGLLLFYIYIPYMLL